MGLFDSRKKDNVRKLIGAASIQDCCIENYSGTKTGFLIISPVNLNVLSKSTIQSLVDNLAKSMIEIGSAEFLCINSAQSYESNKHILNQCILREPNDALKRIDRQDIDFLDDIQVRMATSREFLLILRFLAKDTVPQVISALEKARQIMTSNGFFVTPADKQALKRMQAIYYEQNIYEEEMQEFDGERYSPILEMKK